MNISRVSKDDLKQLCIDLESFKQNTFNETITTERLTLKQQSEGAINNALKTLDSLFQTHNYKEINHEKGHTTKKIENEPKVQVKLVNKNPKPLDIIKEETETVKFNLTIAKKYYNIWKEKTVNKTIIQEPRTDVITDAKQVKEEQIDKFIQGLKAKKTEKLKKDVRAPSARSSSRSSSCTSNKTASSSEVYQNRYKAQRDIILMQKSKLLEQEQKIHELQYGKICEELKESYNDSQHTIKNLLKKFSTRTKVVAGVKIVEEPEEVQMKINKVPERVRFMEQRALERELKRQIIQERKRLIDEEKKRFLEEQLEKKRIQDEEEKKLALDAIKARRRREVEEEKRKQVEKEKYLKKCRIADNFYKKMLKRRAIKRFKMAVQETQNNESISSAFYETLLMRKCLHQWRIKTSEIQSEKIEIAAAHYEYALKRKYFNGFVALRIRARQNMQVAIDYHAYQLQCKAFKAFYLRVNALKIRRYHLMSVAVRHHKTHLLVQAFYQWKSLPAVLQLERAKEEKKRKWREKVLKIIPDYKPPELF